VTVRTHTLVIVALLAAVASETPVHAERLVASLSTHRVSITSNFTGAELVLFGAIERDAASVSRRGGYDIIAMVIGPRQTLVVRRKERVAGLWVNAGSRTFVDVPSYLATLSTRAPATIAAVETLRRLQIGPSYATEDVFRAAVLRLKAQRRLYADGANAVTFLTPTLFRASILLPADVPVGCYDVDVKLFADGAMIARTSSALDIVKDGFEQFVATAAREHGLAYGLASAAMALMTGWLASVVFRKD
jgi:uncharacterized protein (TIGR02186 family)